MRQKELRIKFRQKNLKKKQGNFFVSAPAPLSWKHTLRWARAGGGWEWRCEGSIAPWVNSEAGLASSSGSAASFHLSLNVSAASPQEVSWRPGSGVLRITCVYSLTLLLFLVPFLDDASNPNDPGFEICSFIWHSCFSLYSKSKLLHPQNALRGVSQVKEWNHQSEIQSRANLLKKKKKKKRTRLCMVWSKAFAIFKS